MLPPRHYPAKVKRLFWFILLCVIYFVILNFIQLESLIMYRLQSCFFNITLVNFIHGNVSDGQNSPLCEWNIIILFFYWSVFSLLSDNLFVTLYLYHLHIMNLQILFCLNLPNYNLLFFHLLRFLDFSTFFSFFLISPVFLFACLFQFVGLFILFWLFFSISPPLYFGSICIF